MLSLHILDAQVHLFIARLCSKSLHHTGSLWTLSPIQVLAQSNEQETLAVPESTLPLAFLLAVFTGDTEQRE